MLPAKKISYRLWRRRHPLPGPVSGLAFGFSRPAAGKIRSGGKSSDRLAEISDFHDPLRPQAQRRANPLQAGLAAFQPVPSRGFRSHRVAELKAKIQRGQYHVSGKMLVDKWFAINPQRNSDGME